MVDRRVSPASGGEQKAATAARIYDYYLGGSHNFRADREAAEQAITLLPQIPATARANRAFLRRAVDHLARAGIRQYLDIGSGIPTQGNVHEIAQRVIPDARVVYTDIDTVAVAESLEILQDNPYATAIRGDLRDPRAILDHPQLRATLDLAEPVAILLLAVLHFIPDGATSAVDELRAVMAPGSHLVISHAAAETYTHTQDALGQAKDVYRTQTSTPANLRTRPEVEQFFAGLDLADPGVVWVTEWHPRPDDPTDFDDPVSSGVWVGVGAKGPRS